MHYVYVLKSDTNKLYVGRSSNLKQRLQQHQDKRVKSTKWWQQINLIFYESFLAKSDSVRREKYFKTSKGKSSLKQIIRKSLVQ